MPLHPSRVVVDAEEVDGLLDDLHVLVEPLGPRLAEDLTQLLRILPEEDGVEVLPIHVRIGAPHRGKVLPQLGRRVLRLEIDDQPDLPLLRRLGEAESLHSHPVGAQKIVGRDRRLEQIRVAGGEHAGEITSIGDDPGLIERGPHLDAISQRLEHRDGVVAEPAGNVAIEPAAAIVERFGQIPMVERNVRLDSLLEQRVDEARVEIDALPVDDSFAVGINPPPRHAEPIGVEAELRHERDIFLVAPIVVAGDISGLIQPCVARSMRETVPEARSSAIGGRRSFYLVGGRRCSPQEIIGKAVGITHLKSRMLRKVADASHTACCARVTKAAGLTGAKQWQV